MTPAPLEPKNLGEILSDALGQLRQGFKVYYPLALPFTALALVLREAGSTLFAEARTSLGGIGGTPGLDDVMGGLMPFAIGLIATFASAFVGQILSSGVSALGERQGRGASISVGAGVGVLARKAIPLVVTGLLTMVATMVLVALPALLMVPAIWSDSVIVMVLTGLLVAAAAIIIAVLVSLRWSLANTVVVLEDAIGPAALSRSADLMRGRGLPFFETPKFRVSILFLASFAITSTMSSLFAMPRLLIGLGGDWNLADGLPPLTSLPLATMLVLAIVEVLTQSLVLPFWGLLIALFYVDLRVRFEAVDVPAAASSADGA
jgi:hypothetical protein